MAIPFLRASRLFRALVLTTGVFSFLAWLYIVLRIIVNRVDPRTPFVNSAPSISFISLGAFSFGLAFLSVFVYLWLWGWSSRTPTISGGPRERAP